MFTFKKKSTITRCNNLLLSINKFEKNVYRIIKKSKRIKKNEAKFTLEGFYEKISYQKLSKQTHRIDAWHVQIQ